MPLAPYDEKELTLEDEDIEIGKGSPPWMTTYSDLVTQLLIFFVMMFALAATLNELQLREIKRRLEGYAIRNRIEDVLSLEITHKGLVISLSEKLMFDSGQAEIYEEAKELLADISREIVDIPNDVRIEGHTDSVPISTEQFPSNWELSTARATNIARFLIENLEFPPDRISAGGFSKYHPAVSTPFEVDIAEYKRRVRQVPGEFSRELARARTEDEEAKIHLMIREKQLDIQRQMQGVLNRHLEAANRTPGERALNRRVDIIVARLGSGFDSAEPAVSVTEYEMP